MSKFNKNPDERIIPNPTYCHKLNFSPTIKYAKTGTEIFPSENKATVVDVSIFCNAI